MVSRSKDIRIWFDHYCFNTNERRKIVAIDRTDQLKIIYKPRSFLKTIEQAKPIRLEDRLEAFEINEEAWLWAKTLAGKILYLFDRNDPVDSAENGYGPTIKLIQVNLGSTNKREQELFFTKSTTGFCPETERPETKTFRQFCSLPENDRFSAQELCDSDPFSLGAYR